MSFFFKRALLLVGAVLALNSFAEAAPAKRSIRSEAKSSKRVAVIKPHRSHKRVRKISMHRDDDWESGVLSVNSSAALVLDQDSGEVLYAKNADNVVPIASITKLMTAMVVLDSTPDLQEEIAITSDDIDTIKHSHSRLPVGTELSREQAMLLALMSSENRAAHALGRTYPGGLEAFVAAMNAKAESLGMLRTRFVDPTGLSSDNQSTASDLARMVAAAHSYPIIRELSTTSSAYVEVGRRPRPTGFNNTNALIKNPQWTIGLSKTGYIQEAGKCLVMQAWVGGRSTVIVLLDAAGKLTRIGDAVRVKRWVEQRGTIAADTSAKVSS
jgi:serine-type D-Ala-D-Ala endopeptidase (penicillin-binding protein 7)